MGAQAILAYSIRSRCWHLGLACRGWHPGWLLLLRHHLEVWGRPPDLSDYLCQVEAGDAARLRMLGSTGNMPRSGVARLFFLMRWKAAASMFFSGAIFDLGPPSPHSRAK